MNGCPKDCITNQTGPMQDHQTCRWSICVNVYRKRSLSPVVPCTTFCRDVEIRHLRGGLAVWHIPFLIVLAVILCLQLAAVASVVVSILARCRFIGKRWCHEDSLRLLSCFFISSLLPVPWYCQITPCCCTKQGPLGAQSWRETVVLRSSQEGEYACMCVMPCFFLHGRKKEHIPCPFLPPWDHSTQCCGWCCLSHSPVQVQDHTRGPAILLPSYPAFCLAANSRPNPTHR